MISPVEEPVSNINAWPNLFFHFWFQYNHKEDEYRRSRCDFRLNDVLEAHALFFPVANGDDALALAIPLEVIAFFLIQRIYSFVSCARRE